MTTPKTSIPVNFNLAVETLKRKLKLDKAAEASLSQAKEPLTRAESDIALSVPESDSKLGQIVNTDV